MTCQLVLIHGRSQEHKHAAELKGEWLTALRTGLGADRELTLADEHIRFPYYGQTLYDMLHGVPDEQVAEVIVRGIDEDEQKHQFMRDVAEELQARFNITDEQINAEDAEAVERGPTNWRWVRGVIKALDRVVPGASARTIRMVTNDVYNYLYYPGIRDEIDKGVREALLNGVPTVLVTHSLGTVVGYNLLHRDGEAQGWNIPLFVTLGSPLAVTAIRKALRPLKFPECVGHWFNAMDRRDVVSLYPLDKKHFPFRQEREIENLTDVDNDTPNRHGISGYLKDQRIAAKIADALAQNR